MKLVAGLLLALLALLHLRLWLGNESMLAVWHLESAIEAQHLENERLGRRNARLAAEVADLKAGLEAVEERARHELGMIGRDETFYQFVE